MKRLLFILDHLDGGGAEIITLQLAAQLTSLYSVGIAVVDGTNSSLAIPEQCHAVSLNIDPAFIRSNFWRTKHFSVDEQHNLQESIAHFKPDLIVVGFWNSFHLSSIINHPHVFYWLHGDILYKSSSKAFYYLPRDKIRELKKPGFINKIFKNKQVLVVNEHLKQKLSKYCPDTNFFTLPNGIVPPTTSIKEKKTWEVIFVGRLAEEKQPEHALIAFAKSGLQGRMAVVGNGVLLEELKQLCITLGIDQRVDFLGWQTNAADFIYQSKCLLNSSKTEGSPLTIMEAIHLNIPVVSYECSAGIVEQLSSNELKKGLVEPQNISALSEKLYEIVTTPYAINEQDKIKLSMDRMMRDFIRITHI